jgi:diacylglycerol kinase (ATP)
MRHSLNYRIVANPASGALSMDRRMARLKQAAAVLAATVHGLDTSGAQELADCFRTAAGDCDVLVVAGGDGTFSLALNSVDLSQVALAFLPFGTGNALTHALGYHGDVAAIAKTIRDGTVRHCDLIDCDGRETAFMVSLGIDGTVIRLYEYYRARGYRGLNAHLRAALRAFFREHRPTGGWVAIDGRRRRVERLLSLAVVKQPYFGMGLKVMPGARWDDGRLHVRAIGAGLPGAALGLITGFTIGNRAGEYLSGRRLTVSLDTPQPVQIDGELGWTSRRFVFRVMPRAMAIKY